MSRFLDRRVSVAPMMDWTDRHCRYFLRGFHKDLLLYTEMLTASAILRGERERLLEFSAEEHPLALQLGGCEPDYLAAAARYGEEWGYDEINLNCGCPSDKVQKGAFGACLLNEPRLVADCISAMCAAVALPVTVKMRIGALPSSAHDLNEAVQRFDEADYDKLADFLVAVRAAGADCVIVHARKAVLGHWTPAENREIPPLRYDVVRRLKEDFPDMPVLLNGGLKTVGQSIEALEWADGVMLGREAYHRPMVLGELFAALEADVGYRAPSVEDHLSRMAEYAERELSKGERLHAITRHMLSLLSHTPGSREYRRLLSEGARERDAGPELLHRAASQVTI
ncbi:MAG: tRNA dihydrouridine(20/20a) synthase DusA [Gammaproteobacteria bacterium]|nr:tRNA dihydrouridine(20/20a) synthase DusA [Gammaproteobacteria bacterium]